MEKFFNPNVRAKYLENPDICPNCNKENNMTACNFEADTRVAYRDIVCNNCNCVFQEIYNLADIKKLN